MKYNCVSRLLHWVIALLILGLLAVGLYMADMDFSPFSVKLYGLHKATGIAVLALVIFRVIWRLKHTPPPLPESLPERDKRLAGVAHLALYILMFVMPISGWAMSSSYGFPVSFFGLFTLPNISPADKELAHTFHEIHEVAAYALMGIIALHILAALYHGVVRKDGVLQRMLWGAVIAVFVSASTFTPAPAHAEELTEIIAKMPVPPVPKKWVFQKDNSYIRFTATVNNAPSEGAFTTYTANITPNLENLTKTRGTIEVSLAEIDSAYPMVGDTLQKRDWFNTAKWPTATFEIVQIQQVLKENKYNVTGNLKIRATTQPVTFVMTVEKQTADELVFTGSGTIKRLDFGVGQGEWASTSTVENDIKLDLKASYQAF